MTTDLRGRRLAAATILRVFVRYPRNTFPPAFMGTFVVRVLSPREVESLRASALRCGSRVQAEDLPVRFRFPSREDEILGAAERALAAARALGFAGDRGAPRLKLALIELIGNAIEHGNRFDPDRTIEIAVEGVGGAAGGRLPERLRIAVADEGPGFDPARLERDVADVPLEAKRGRGLSIVKRILGRRPDIGRDASGRFAVAIEFGRESFA
jgi:anti-sigma regulatory factor (Ser/Thr protein kinase)